MGLYKVGYNGGEIKDTVDTIGHKLNQRNFKPKAKKQWLLFDYFLKHPKNPLSKNEIYNAMYNMDEDDRGDDNIGQEIRILRNNYIMFLKCSAGIDPKSILVAHNGSYELNLDVDEITESRNKSEKGWFKRDSEEEARESVAQLLTKLLNEEDEYKAQFIEDALSDEIAFLSDEDKKELKKKIRRYIVDNMEVLSEEKASILREIVGKIEFTLTVEEINNMILWAEERKETTKNEEEKKMLQKLIDSKKIELDNLLFEERSKRL